MWQPDDEHPFQYQTPTEDTNVLNRTEGSAATGVVLLDAFIGFYSVFRETFGNDPLSCWRCMDAWFLLSKPDWTGSSQYTSRTTHTTGWSACIMSCRWKRMDLAWLLFMVLQHEQKS